jgi:hypothetical protein
MEKSGKPDIFFIKENYMKKQIIAAAVAASVSAVALADISITGAAQVNYTNTETAGVASDGNKFTHESSLKVTGKTGDTTFVMGFGGGALDNTAATTDTTAHGTFNAEDVYMQTSVNGISVKAGQWDNGNNELRQSARNNGKLQLGTKVGNVNLGMLTSSSGASAEEYTVGTSLGGVAVSFTKKAAGETIKASGSFGGINVKYLGLPSDSANSDKDYIELSTKVGDVAVKVGQANAESSTAINGDSWLSDFETITLSNGQDVTGVELKTSMAGNTLTYRNISVDDLASNDMDINKFIVTRPLASGATMEATYTSTDDDQAANTDVFDLELRVAF